MQLQFTKMHGCGNDYIYLDCRATGLPRQVSQWAVDLSRRRLSVGADGIICICPPTNPGSDATMRMFNNDGSEGRMCGNGIRCVAQFLREHGIEKDTLHIDTPLDMATPTKTLRYMGDTCWQVAMGSYRNLAGEIPALNMGQGALVNVPLTVEGKRWFVSCINVGNPHCVTVMDEPVAGLELEKIGPAFESHRNFPEKINTEFVRVHTPTHLEMRVWERGSGETFACGTGTCATVAACIELGLCQYDTDVKVDLRGGSLTIRISPDRQILMTGPATTVYTATTEV